MSIFDKLRSGTPRSRQVEALIEKLHRNQEADRARHAQDTEAVDQFVRFLEETLQGYIPADPEEEPGPVDAAIRFYATGDRMRAYACLLPPLDGGADIRIDVFGKELLRTGITYGIDETVSMGYLTKKEYLHIFPIASGVKPVDGEDGKVEFLFQPRPVYTIEVREGKTADFSDPRPIQLAVEGETICRVTPATPGKDGTDILGKTVPCKPGRPADVQLGYNMVLTEDGTRIVTKENGAVFVKDGVPFVQTAVIRLGEGRPPLKKVDDLVWIAYIDGDVPEGVKLTCTNGLVVMGEIRGATVTARGSVRAQRGIRAGSVIEAKGQVLAPVIEESTVRAGKEVIAEVIRDSQVISERSVYALAGEGSILGGSTQARDTVECFKIGGSARGGAKFDLGHSQDLDDEIAKLNAELTEAKNTIEILMKNVVKLRMVGSGLSTDSRNLLDQLVEQRELYEKRITDLNARLQEAMEERAATRECQLVCRSMEPPVTLRIGDKTSEFTVPAADCRFRLYAGQITTR